MPKQDTKKNILVIIIFTSIIIIGITLGLIYSYLPEHHPQKNRQFCENAGGLWTDNQTCLLSYKNTGESCTDGGQCISGICFPPTLTEEQKISLTQGPLNNIVGTCYPQDLATGCVKQVIKGTVSQESMCLND